MKLFTVAENGRFVEYGERDFAAHTLQASWRFLLWHTCWLSFAADSSAISRLGASGEGRRVEGTASWP